MKKYMALVGSILMVSGICWGQAVSPACSGGHTITAKNGRIFCLSNEPMSWFAAHAWCHKNGRKMALRATVCADSTQNTCDNIAGTGDNTKYKWGFLNQRKDNSSIFRVNLVTGANPNTTTPVNRAVGSAKTGETSTYGGINDMFALCD